MYARYTRYSRYWCPGTQKYLVHVYEYPGTLFVRVSLKLLFCELLKVKVEVEYPHNFNLKLCEDED